jgi:putative glycosyltransferase (TIGR04372 family)
MISRDKATKMLREIKDFFYAVSKWLIFTMRGQSRLENIRHVMSQLAATFESAVATQSNPSLSTLRLAYREVARGDLDKADFLYKEAIRHDSRNPDVYFLRAACLTYLRGDPNGVDRELKQGLSVSRQIAHELGLGALSLKIIGNDFAGMGHLALLDPLIKLKKLGVITNSHVMVVQSSSVANTAYLNCWRKHLPVIVTDASRYWAIKNLFGSIFENLSMWEARGGYLPLFQGWNMALDKWADSSPLLTLDHETELAGRDVLKKVGIPPGSWFVGLHVREGKKGGALRSGADADIRDYQAAIKRIVDKGGWVIRMGRGGMPLPASAQVWDYANSYLASDWMDVFLWATCRFFVGTSSGPLSVPPTFGRPVLHTNACAIGNAHGFPGSVMLPKLLWSEDRQAFLNFSEMFKPPYGWTVLPEYDSGRTKLVSNTPQEIVRAVDEMLDSLDGKRPLASDPQMQEAFEAIRVPYMATSRLRVADSFLHSHKDLLR